MHPTLSQALLLQKNHSVQTEIQVDVFAPSYAQISLVDHLVQVSFDMVLQRRWPSEKLFRSLGADLADFDMPADIDRRLRWPVSRGTAYSSAYVSQHCT